MSASEGRRQLAAVMFTDIVGYTALMQADERAAIESRTKFQQVLRLQHDAFGGVVVELRGDGALTIFPSSVDAIRCATAIQRECSELPVVPLRVGIHAGEVIVDEHNVIGDAVNIASRIESFGVPGGVLVSDAVYEQAKNQPGLDFVRLGTFRLKNVGRPFEIYALLGPGLAVPDSQLLEGKGERFASLPSNLPQPATPLIGRDDDVAAVLTLVERNRVVTITGPGGMGKTRLAIEIGQRVTSQFLDGVCFVPLAAVTDATEFVPALAAVLDVKEAEGRTTADGIVALIGDREALLILDNLEQVVSAAPEVAGLVARCSNLRVLATSQAPLRITGEQQYALSPLGLPAAGGGLDPEKVTAHTSVVLFVDRARATKIGFEVTAENADAIGAICRRLDGLPLAIELAAARVGFLSPHTLLQRLDHALDVLATGGRDRPDRQLTLRAAIDWSHALLTESEQRLFRRLAVFQTAASLESIEAVCGQDDGDVFGDLGSLVDKSLVRAIGDGDRFGMLQTVREFALERLSAAGEVERLRLGHARQLARIVAQISVGIEGGNQAGSIELGVTEDSDIRAALDLLLDRAKSGDAEAAELGMKMCGDLWMFWHIRARHLSARSYAAGFLDAAGGDGGGPSRGRAGALLALGLALWTLGRFEEANQAALESYRVADECDDPRVRALAAMLGGIGHLGIDMAKSTEWSERAIELSRSAGLLWALSFSMSLDGVIQAASGDAVTAAARYSEALVGQRAIEDMEGTGLSLSGLAQLAAGRGDHTAAIGLYRQSLAAYERIGDRAEEARILYELAGAQLAINDAPAARRTFLDSVQAYRDIGSVRGIGTSLIGLAAVEAVYGRAAQAVRIASAADVFAREEGIVNVYSEGFPGHDHLERARASLTADELAAAEAAGRHLTVDEALDLSRGPEVAPIST